MLTLENDHLYVEILDPQDDADYLGTRYCSGGYIFQITDKKHGPLLSGPTYPESFNTFDGQGIPDSFSLAPLKGARPGGPALVLGVGLCDLVSRTLIEPCLWEIEQDGKSIRFATRHNFLGWTIVLERRLFLEGRTVRSNTAVSNAGSGPFPIIWFPHPFFPQLPEGTDELIKLNLDVSLPNNEGFKVSPGGYIQRRGWPWKRDHHQALNYSFGDRMVIIQRHPVLGQISASCDYVPTYFPIWGNRNTFSWEPMIERTIGLNQKASWNIAYDF